MVSPTKSMPSTWRTVLCAPSHPMSQLLANVSSVPLELRRVETTLSGLAVKAVNSTLRSTVTPTRIEILLQQALGFALRNHQAIGMCRMHVFEGEVGDQLFPRRNVRAEDFHAIGRDAGVRWRRSSNSMVRLQIDQGLRFIGALRGLLNDADGDAEAVKVDGHSQADGARSYDQYVWIHGCTSPI